LSLHREPYKGRFRIFSKAEGRSLEAKNMRSMHYEGRFTEMSSNATLSICTVGSRAQSDGHKIRRRQKVFGDSVLIQRICTDKLQDASFEFEDINGAQRRGAARV
jgi:hypothetical protein